MIKKLLRGFTLVLALAICVQMLPLAAFAAPAGKEWREEDGRWYVYDTEAGAKLGGFQYKAEGEETGWYYFFADGALPEEGLQVIANANRLVLPSGRLATGWVTMGDAQCYFGGIGSGYVGKQIVGGNILWFNAQCAVQENAQPDGWVQREGRWYLMDYITGKNKTGLQNKTTGEDIGTYFYDEEGNLPQEGKANINGTDQWVDAVGRVSFGWRTDASGNRFYLNEAGVLCTGRTSITADDVETVYWFNADGMLMENTQDGWVLVQDRWHLLDADTGAWVTGLQAKVGGDAQGIYYFDENGALPEAEWANIGGAKQWVEANGRLATGWQEIESKRYYFDAATGNAATGQCTVDDVKYDFGSDGALVGEVMAGWVKVNERWYLYAEDTGAKMTGLQQKTQGADQGTYYYDENGNLLAEGITEFEGNIRWVTAVGSFYTGWKELAATETQEAATYYFDADGNALKGMQTVDGVLYIFDDTTAVLTDTLLEGWVKFDGRWYLYEAGTGNRLTGFQLKKTGDDQGWYYYNADGSLPLTGWFYTNGVKRWVEASGRFSTGWQVVNGATYYFGGTGNAYVGKQIVSGKLYWFDAEGVVLDNMQDGWTKRNGKWYYIDYITGKSTAGVQTKTTGEDQGLYYYTAEGALLPEGLVTALGNRYCVESTGRLYTGLKTIDNKTYYFGSNGAMCFGWQTVNGHIYYFGADGAMYAGGSFTIGEKPCIFSAQGYYVAAPVIQLVTTNNGSTKGTVTVTASASLDGALHATAYSFDGGATWQAANSKEFAAGTTLAAGKICVRDTVGNVASYSTAIEIKNVSKAPFYGVDVSSYQGVVDWKAVKESGIDFAIIRALTWSNSVGYYVIDPYFEFNVRNAKANGIKVGAYLFSYAFNTTEVVEEIDFFHNSAQMKALTRDGVKFDYPVYYDFEWNTILSKTSYSQRTEMVRLAMIKLERYGYYPGFYSSHAWATSHYDARQLYNEGYDFWYARYLAAPNITAGTQSLLGWTAQMWQYASDGSVRGINGDCDVNICYVDYSTKIAGSSSSSSSTVSPTFTVYDVNTKKQVAGNMDDIIAQIVANEVSSLNNTELFKAQAVAARSWLLYQQAHGNAVPSVGLATASAAVKSAVAAVSGQTLYYNNAAVNAAYGSCSGAYTNTAANMWGLDLPYLNTPVESPENVSAYRSKKTEVKLSTMQTSLSAIVGDVVNSYPHDQWITDPVFNAQGYLSSIKVCGMTVSGGRFYENCWGLYSPKFSVTYNKSTDSWSFITEGNGHCVGMSQYGALAYANQGWGYAQILSHYYPGTTLK